MLGKLSIHVFEMSNERSEPHSKVQVNLMAIEIKHKSQHIITLQAR